MQEERLSTMARVGTVVGAIVAAMAAAPGCSSEPMATVEVRRGEFVIDIETTGELQAVESRAVSRPRQDWSRSAIVRMAPEGSFVEAGDFLIQFDTSEAERNLEEAKSQYENAQAELASQRASAASRAAELKTQLQNQEFSHEQAKIRFEQMKYEADIRRREQELELRKAELALQEAREKIESQKIVDAANLRKAELTLEQSRMELQKQEAALGDLTITAPLGGMVVYKKIWNPGGGRTKVKVGDTPWPGMELIEIPDLTRMRVLSKVNEVDIDRVRAGQTVRVVVDALPDTTFTGELVQVATLAQREGESEVKTFEVEVHIEGSHSRLRPGMTASCRILIDRLSDVVFVPLESVFQDEERTVCYVMNGSLERRVVQLGLRNADFVVVEDGLSAGERVTLRDPNLPIEDVGGEPPPDTEA